MSDTHSTRDGRRRQALAIVAIFVVIGAAAWVAWWFLFARYSVSTDDAYVSGDILAVTAREAGTVLAVHADNTQWVQRGKLLVELDPANAQVGLDAAEADLARTVRNVRGLFSKANTLRAQIAQSRVALDQAQKDYARRVEASGDGAVSNEDVTHARDALAAAKAALAAAESALKETLDGIDGTTLETHPDVLAAEARVRNAALSLSYTRIVAPADGVVAQKNIEPGEQISAGTPLLAVVPLDDVWIDANFKESQLAHMRVGQPVRVTADLYGGGVVYHGRIAGLAAGSGSAFALLPPQNASGNWIKIVQRIPVRIALDPHELHEHPLRVGLSVVARADLRDESGPLLSATVRAQEPLAVKSAALGTDADAIIVRIVAANSGSGP
jgi:membrane fusion protein (multidrug efflux system)